jgi:hypothetical protein
MAARYYIEIVTTAKRLDPTNTENLAQHLLEYEQAHRVCNQSKSNINFIVDDETTRIPKIFLPGIHETVTKIKARAAGDLNTRAQGPLRDIMSTIADMDPAERIAAITARVQPILDFITRGDAGKEKWQALLLLARVAGLRETKNFNVRILQAYKESVGVDAAEQERLQGLINSSEELFRETFSGFYTLTWIRSDITEALGDAAPAILTPCVDSARDTFIRYIAENLNDNAAILSARNLQNVTSTFAYGVYLALLNNLIDMIESQEDKEPIIGVIAKVVNILDTVNQAPIIAPLPPGRKIFGIMPTITAETLPDIAGELSKYLRDQRAAASAKRDQEAEEEAREAEQEIVEAAQFPQMAFDRIRQIYDIYATSLATLWAGVPAGLDPPITPAEEIVNQTMQNLVDVYLNVLNQTGGVEGLAQVAAREAVDGEVQRTLDYFLATVPMDGKETPKQVTLFLGTTALEMKDGIIEEEEDTAVRKWYEGIQQGGRRPLYGSIPAPRKARRTRRVRRTRKTPQV